MTDKQIIIDDLDTRCPYHCSEKIGQCNNPSQETPHTYCINNKDCIYKQYTRKEQECEELKENLPNAITRLMGELDQLKAENEKLKEILNEGCLHNLTLMTEQRVLLQTLAEIKEIAEEVYNDEQIKFQASGVCYEILQKINEVEDE